MAIYGKAQFTFVSREKGDKLRSKFTILMPECLLVAMSRRLYLKAKSSRTMVTKSPSKSWNTKEVSIMSHCQRGHS
ncbi:hypothetical protein FQN60_006432 [Etheostoma spectabile]|uniref:Uncharacterized protein n=1 Tax=Etheostoma spectabile TaxID=54343 RepID=A0A5J5CTI8_9PERO|nr:hypothetical protein FQN60_006432 [Etheostoma spectabile]